MKRFLITATSVFSMLMFTSCIKDDPPVQSASIEVTVDALNDVDGGTITFG